MLSVSPVSSFSCLTCDISFSSGPHPAISLSYYRFQNNISQYAAYGVQKQIVHIKASHPAYKLKRLHQETKPETVHRSQEKAAVSARHGHEKSKGNENQHVPKQIRIGYPANLTPVIPEPFYLLEQNQIILVILHLSAPPVPVCQNQKIREKRNVQHKRILPSMRNRFLFCLQTSASFLECKSLLCFQQTRAVYYQQHSCHDTVTFRIIPSARFAAPAVPIVLYAFSVT